MFDYNIRVHLIPLAFLLLGYRGWEVSKTKIKLVNFYVQCTYCVYIRCFHIGTVNQSFDVRELDEIVILFLILVLKRFLKEKLDKAT